tara:strand:+ start:782 stop:991 length:210 start_codon:yes stop_codon:yes gene_type:complete
MKCFDCGNKIPVVRIQAVPDTEYCINCVDEHTEPVVARMVYSHKTAGEVFVARGKENIRLLNREYERAR